MKLDSYTIKARVLPFAILILPIVFISIATSIIGLSDYQQIPTYILLSVSFVVSILVRNRGKVVEKKLWAEWGGPPTTRYLRYNNGEYNKVNKERCVNYFKTKCPNISFPTQEYEEENPKEADEIYEACVSTLRIISRDKKKYKLTHSENTDYGFMRNSYGVKIYGCIICSLCIVLSVVIFYDNKIILYKNIKLIISVISSIAFLLYWLLFISKKNIKMAAENYTERLLEICLNI